jgi:hypothetical protein
MMGEGMLNELNVKALMLAGNSIIIVMIHEEESSILVICGSNIQGLWNSEVLKMDYAKAKPQMIDVFVVHPPIDGIRICEMCEKVWVRSDK